ncbi:hypothetical protein GCM10007979_07370 [Nocardioides albus]|nr:hypothetical protein GCM10007979_07370 [Nocardioides albus]
MLGVICTVGSAGFLGSFEAGSAPHAASTGAAAAAAVVNSTRRRASGDERRNGDCVDTVRLLQTCLFTPDAPNQGRGRDNPTGHLQELPKKNQRGPIQLDRAPRTVC